MTWCREYSSLFKSLFVRFVCDVYFFLYLTHILQPAEEEEEEEGTGGTMAGVQGFLSFYIL